MLPGGLRDVGTGPEVVCTSRDEGHTTWPFLGAGLYVTRGVLRAAHGRPIAARSAGLGLGFTVRRR